MQVFLAKNKDLARFQLRDNVHWCNEMSTEAKRQICHGDFEILLAES